MMIPWSSGTLFGDFTWGVFAASAGGAAGLTIGVFEARMVERELAAERNRVRREEAERRSARLDDFARIVSHDLRNPLNVAAGNLEFVRNEHRDTQLDAVAAALDRMEEIIQETLTLARSGQVISDPEPVALFGIVESCWRTVDTDDAELLIENSLTFRADPDRVRHLFENLLRNSVEHGDSGVTIRVGALDDGFYVEDDGPGIPDDERDRAFDAGYSTTDDGTGFGLAIVKQISDAHGWKVDVRDASGGARFEFTGVETLETERELAA